jgi:hypothetical protein
MTKKIAELTASEKNPVNMLNKEILYLTFLAEIQRKVPDNYITEDVLSKLREKLNNNV